MKIGLVSPYTDFTSIGLRIISSILKRDGHDVRFLFMPDFKGDDLYIGKKRYSEDALSSMVKLLKGVDLIGITVMTNFFDSAREITSALKRSLNIPIIWGGVHPTVMPEESLLFADMVCVGEGEEATLELIQTLEKGGDPYSIRNIWFKRDGNVIKNPVRPLIQDLDSLPFPDYSLEDHFILKDNDFVPFSEELLKEGMSRITFGPMFGRFAYQTMSGRGCPHACSYCWNIAFRKMHKGERYLRWRSIRNFVDELKEIKGKFPFINFFTISDDAFFARKDEEIEEFATLYREEIGEPFFCLSSPIFVTERKVRALVDAGMILMQIGMESGSRQTLETYNRRIKLDVMLESARIVNRFCDRLLPQYDILIDNPFETDEDRRKTLKFILNLPDPKIVQPFSLRLYPGTELFDRAKREELIDEDFRVRFPGGESKLVGNYYYFLMRMIGKGKVPKGLMRFLSSSNMEKILAREGLYPLYHSVGKAARTFYWMWKRRVIKYV